VSQEKAEGNIRDKFNLEEGETSPEVMIDAESQMYRSMFDEYIKLLSG